MIKLLASYISNVFSGERRNSLAYRLLLYILFFSLLLTLLISILQLYVDYKSEIKAIDQRMAQLEKSYKKSLSNAMWFLDKKQIINILSGIMKFSDINYVEVTLNGDEKYTVGKRRETPNVRQFTVPIQFITNNQITPVGNLLIESNLERVNERLMNKIWLSLLAQIINIFCITIFILVLTYYLVTRHLRAIASFTKDIQLTNLDNVLQLSRRRNTTYLDELDHIVLAINQMRENLIKDLEMRKQTQEKLRLSIRVFNETREGIIITDPNVKIIDVNPAFTTITGYSQQDVVGKSPNILKSEKHASQFYLDMWEVLDTQGFWQGEVWNRKKDHSLYAQLMTITTILDDKGQVEHYVALFSDITQYKEQQDKMEFLAHYDALTQLPNRILLADRFKYSAAYCDRTDTLLAVCFIDLDKFKPVNDAYGHETGDKFLIEVANRLSINIRDEDTISRLGGDEFVVLLSSFTTISQCKILLDRIIASLNRPYNINGKKIHSSASIGVSFFPSDGQDLDTLIRFADQSMYQVKISGRNGYRLFNVKQDQLLMQKNMHLKAIEHDLLNDRFCLYYQPKVNMCTGEVFGAEALIRWHNKDKGLMEPSEFLPLIADTSLEVTVGDWVIKESLRQLNTWNKQGIKFQLSVNISASHLQSPYFFKSLKKSLTLFPAIKPHFLQLEILESSSLGDINAIVKIIKSCTKELGVKFALDDFGTGYSSLTHLRNLAVETIKIDQTFVQDILDDAKDYNIIASTIGLAKSFHREVIAEGVETEKHGLMLLLMGCQYAQGYAIAKPMPSKEFPAWLTAYQPYKSWLAYDEVNFSDKQKILQLVKLTLHQWLDFIQSRLKSSTTTHQPSFFIKEQCFCEYWIDLLKQDKTTKQDELEKIHQIHALIHTLANELYEQLHGDDNLKIELTINHLKDNIEKFIACFKSLLNIGHS